MLEAKLDFDHKKRNDNRNTDELGWKLFILRLVHLLAILTVKLAWLGALVWAFNTMLNRMH